MRYRVDARAGKPLVVSSSDHEPLLVLRQAQDERDREFCGSMLLVDARVSLVAILALTSVGLLAQSAQPLRDQRLFRSGIELTSLSATVTDRDGRLISDVAREAFEV